MGIRQLDKQRRTDHKYFIKKSEGFLFDMKELKDQLVKMTNEQEAKSRFLIDETHKACKAGNCELQETICSILRSVSANKSINEIITISKDNYIISYILKYQPIMTSVAKFGFNLEKPSKS